MSHYETAGRLDQPAQVLALCGIQPNVWEWTPIRNIWISVKIQQKFNIFSTFGIRAQNAALAAWRQDLTLHNAIRQGGAHFFLTSITEKNRNQLDIAAAVCFPVPLTAEPQDRKGRDTLNRPTAIQQAALTFPGILTEKYIRSEAEEVFRTNLRQRILVTPKAILLRPGDLIRPQGESPYTVRQVMDLDPYKNEYVIERQEDV